MAWVLSNKKGSGGGGSSGHDYSTEEQIVGTWIDGSPVYEKTVNTGSFSISSNTGYTIATDSSISSLIEATGCVVESGITYILPELSIRVKMDSSHNIVFYTESSWNISDGFITIRYTKSSS